MNELSYLCGLKNHAMNSEKFAEITARCQPHEVFSNEWTTYYPDDFADTLLPDAGIIKGKSLRFYDGAGIVPLTSSFPQHYMKLSTNDQIVSLIFFSYPKGVTAGEKIEGIRLGHDELWIHCSTYLSAITSTGQKASDAHVTALQNELKEMKSGTLPAKEEILPPDDYYLYWDCTDFISQRKEMGELVITMAVVTADGNSVTKTYSKITSKEFFQNVKENNYIIILDANDEEVQVFGASIIDRQTRFIKRIAEIYDTLSDKHKLILHLPEIMVKLGWLHGALCQIHWLEGSKATLKFPYEFFMSEERVENIDKIKLEEYFKGIRYISHTNTENLSYMPSNPDGDNFFLYNEKFEEVKKSLNLFLENLEKKADFIVIGGNEKLKQNISDKVLPVNENYFQAFSIGNSAAVLDDLGAAVGRCIMRCFYQGDLHKDSENDNWTLFVLRVKCQFHDEFNFIDEVNPRNPATWISQPLGFWPDDIVSSNERSLSTKDLILKVVKEIAKALTIHTSDLSYLDNASFRDLKNIIQNDKNKIRPSCEDFFIDSPLKTLDNEFLAKIIPVF